MVFCAGFAKAQSDSCNADSGGPIFLVSSNHVVLVGVVSWGGMQAERRVPRLLHPSILLHPMDPRHCLNLPWNHVY
ncbi:hypothetical protein DSO57_1039263 [Entomophthora muscae]|uniref:Uncharacterized protein n=1 Tax=Entomophthora muscae TaxID=34485 RepID=A0ACC2RPC0_9FUNG|nr:hypothetical protein DSO57_1039263 [Entomophthora muscae]